MRKIAWNPRETWEFLKRLVVKNFGLKIVSLALALITYFALKNMADPKEHGSSNESIVYDTIRKFMTKPVTPEENEKKQTADAATPPETSQPPAADNVKSNTPAATSAVTIPKRQ